MKRTRYTHCIQYFISY